MKELPEEWHKVAQHIKVKYEDAGWKDVEIGLPDLSHPPLPSAPNVFVYATAPSGDRVHYIVTQDEAGFRAIGEFLNSY